MNVDRSNEPETWSNAERAERGWVQREFEMKQVARLVGRPGRRDDVHPPARLLDLYERGAAVHTQADPAQRDAALARERSAYDRGLQAGLAQGAQQARDEQQAQAQEAGYRAGYERGTEAARTEVAREHAAERAAEAQRLHARLEQVEQLQQSIRQDFSRELRRRLDASEDDMVALCHAALGRLLGEALVQPELVAVSLRAIVEDWFEGRGARGVAEPVLVNVHPSDHELLTQCPSEAAATTWPGGFEVIWQPDATVALGGCRIRSGRESLDARLETQLAMLTQTLLQR